MNPTKEQETQARWIAAWIIAFCLLIMVILGGCATVEEPCGFMPVGATQTTVQYVRVYCVGTEV